MRFSNQNKEFLRTHAIRFIVFLGIVSLFADVTYEGARSITGPFLSVLGASATVVGIVVGFGELAGYGLRLISGYLTDRTKQYWTFTFVGYTINLLAVPLLAIAGNWQVASAFIILERIGKSIRVPPRDALLSYATKHTGRGWGFGLHESLDQIGAVLGPLLIAAVMFYKQNFRLGFALLAIPAVLSLLALSFAKYSYPRPEEFEPITPKLKAEGLSKTFWLYLLAVGCVALGFADFALISYHFQKSSIVSSLWIPLFYAFAMGIAGISALAMGRLFDKLGVPLLAGIVVFSAFFAPLVFLGGFTSALIGILLWGIGLGAQDSIMRSVIAGLVAAQRRGSAYGIFSLGFGLFWFVGSVVKGVLYDHSILALVIFSLVTQLLSLPLLLKIKKVS